MTQDEIIEMAIEAEFVSHGKPSDEESELFVCVDKDIYKFAKLVADKAFQDGYEKGVAAFNEAVLIEREACAKAWCEEHLDGLSMIGGAFVTCASAIRARGEATHPPQRTWVGLTDDEHCDIWYKESLDWMEYGKAIEAKLKEKNT